MKLTPGKGNDKILKDLRTHDEKVTNGIRKGLMQVGKLLVSHSRAAIKDKNKNGHTYRLRKIKSNKKSKFLSIQSQRVASARVWSNSDISRKRCSLFALFRAGDKRREDSS